MNVIATIYSYNYRSSAQVRAVTQQKIFQGVSVACLLSFFFLLFLLYHLLFVRLFFYGEDRGSEKFDKEMCFKLADTTKFLELFYVVFSEDISESEKEGYRN